ncbi:MAG TPA: protoporphyrinogen oxidase, partial [Opitutus sp.]|nr:protoporphyrinogen oxidase [Opitutus sp.]
MASPPKSIAVLGAGVTGLVAAHRLTKLGHRVRIFERTERAGGAIRSEQTDGWLIEAGPNSLLSGEPALARLLDEIGLSAQVIQANPSARNRFVVRNGRLAPVPLSPPAFIASGLFSTTGKLRMLFDLLSRPRVRPSDLPLSEFMRGHFGDEFVDYALNPLVAGVYAGNPSKLSTRYAFPKLWELEQRYGSLIRGQMAEGRLRKARGDPAPSVFSFRPGMQTLTDALVKRLPAGCIAHTVSLEAITRSEEKWNVIWDQSGATHTQTFDGIVGALPAYALAQL